MHNSLCHFRHTVCPMCRVPIGTTWRFDQQRKPLNFDHLKALDHIFCESEITCPYAREYISKLHGEWCRLFTFMGRSQARRELYSGVKGIEYLKLEKYEKEGRLLNKGDIYATFKSESGKIQVLCTCMIPFLSIRLIITANEDDTPIEADNGYADMVVGYVTSQLDACWKALPRLFERSELYRTYIRRFETHTVTLCLGGMEDVGIDDRHLQPSEKQLKSLKTCNFDPSFHDLQIARFPRLDPVKCLLDPGYFEMYCC